MLYWLHCQIIGQSDNMKKTCWLHGTQGWGFVSHSLLPILFSKDRVWLKKTPIINHFASIVKENSEWTRVSRSEVELQGHVNVRHGAGMEIEGTRWWWGGWRLMTSVAFTVVTPPRPSDLSGWWSRVVHWWRRLAITRHHRLLLRRVFQLSKKTVSELA